jgi:diguanylate cyclase (GGDEF)-like protein
MTDQGTVRRPAGPWRLHAYLGLVWCLGAAGLVLTLWAARWPSFAGPEAWAIGFLMVAAVVGEVRPVPITRGHEASEAISTSAPFVLALLAVGGLGVAVAVQAVASLCDDVVHRRSLVKSAFNTAQYVVSVVVARAVFCAITGIPFFGEPVRVEPGHLGALLIAGAVMVVANRLLVAVVVTLATGHSLRAVLRDDGRFILATHLVLLCIGAVAAAVTEDGVAVLALLGGPVVAVYATATAATRHAHQASHDSLTGLGNRERLHRLLSAHLSEAAASGPGLVLLDLDHFKTINDSLGHPVGDVLLREVAARLRSALGDDISAHRLGGDEFAVVVDGDLAQTQQVARTLLTSLEAPMRVGRLELLVRASAGVAVAPEHGTSTETLMKNADIALYHAKLERDRISTFFPALDVNSVDRLQLLADLRSGLETGQLGVV